MMTATKTRRRPRLGVEPSERHRWLLSSYLLNQRLGRRGVGEIIVGDLRRYLDFGVPARAADLLIMLRLYLSETGHGVPASSHTHPMGTTLARARRRPRIPAHADIGRAIISRRGDSFVV